MRMILTFVVMLGLCAPALAKTVAIKATLRVTSAIGIDDHGQILTDNLEHHFIYFSDEFGNRRMLVIY